MDVSKGVSQMSADPASGPKVRGEFHFIKEVSKCVSQMSGDPDPGRSQIQDPRFGLPSFNPFDHVFRVLFAKRSDHQKTPNGQAEPETI